MASKNSIDQLIRSEWNKHEQLQLTIWDTLYDAQKNGSCVTPTEPTHEPTHEQNPKPTHEQKIMAWVQVYPVTRRGKKHKYFRFCYQEEPGNIGSCVRVHLPGGNIHSSAACALKQKVETAIASKLSPEAIVEIIKSSTHKG